VLALNTRPANRDAGLLPYILTALQKNKSVGKPTVLESGTHTSKRTMVPNARYLFQKIRMHDISFKKSYFVPLTSQQLMRSRTGARSERSGATQTRRYETGTRLADIDVFAFNFAPINVARKL
jgi:hypothetical protein